MSYTDVAPTLNSAHWVDVIFRMLFQHLISDVVLTSIFLRQTNVQISTLFQCWKFQRCVLVKYCDHQSKEGQGKESHKTTFYFLFI